MNRVLTEVTSVDNRIAAAMMTAPSRIGPENPERSGVTGRYP
jgi:hypothetical protein